MTACQRASVHHRSPGRAPTAWKGTLRTIRQGDDPRSGRWLVGGSWASIGVMPKNDPEGVARGRASASEVDVSDEAAADVVAKERALLRPAVRRDRAVVDGLLHEAFREFGASGRTRDRSGIADKTRDGGPPPNMRFWLYRHFVYHGQLTNGVCVFSSVLIHPGAARGLRGRRGPRRRPIAWTGRGPVRAPSGCHLPRAAG